MRALSFFSTQPGNWERVSWGSDYFGVTVPQMEDPGHTLVLMAGTEPMAYVIPFPEIRPFFADSKLFHRSVRCAKSI